jgi:protein associated with RNAse G/E
MENEKYHTWNPIKELPQQFYLNRLYHGDGLLKLLFNDLNSNKENQLSIIFKNCLSYRVTQESGRSKSLDNPTLGQFNKSTNSQFISWFRDEGLGIYDEISLTHYAIVNLDNIIDVICIEEPFVEWL